MTRSAIVDPDTSLEIEVPSALVVRVSVERLIHGKYAGKVKLVVGTSSAILSEEEVLLIADKLLSLGAVR